MANADSVKTPLSSLPDRRKVHQAITRGNIKQVVLAGPSLFIHPGHRIAKYFVFRVDFLIRYRCRPGK